MEIVTRRLNAAQLLAEIPEIVEMFRLNGLEHLTVEFGWGSGQAIDQCWYPHLVSLVDLESFIQRRLNEDVFLPGQSDLFIRDSTNVVEFLLCHESDIHLRTENAAIAKMIEQAWDRKGYRR
jgi:hypothetical protein